MNLASCLAETYRNMGDVARRSEESLAAVGMIGLYTDGDTTNSDYDITNDLGKINSILFSEKIDYIGKKNTAMNSYKNLAQGGDVGSLFGNVNTGEGTNGTDGE